MQNRSALFLIHLWNMTERVAEGYSRTNNSTEAFFNVWNSHLTPKPRLSKFMKRVVKETQRWRMIVEDYIHNPADGIRGGLVRRKKWIRQDQNLRLYLNDFLQTEPAQYCRTRAQMRCSEISRGKSSQSTSTWASVSFSKSRRMKHKNKIYIIFFM